MAVFGCLTAIFILVSPEFNLKGGRLGMDFSAKIRSSPLAIGELGGFLLLVAPLLVLPRRKLWIDAIRVLVLMTGVILSIYSGSRGQFFFAVILALLFFPVSRPVKNIAQFFLLSIGSVILLGAILLVVSFLVGNVDVAQRWLNASENDRAVGIRAANMMDMLEGFFTTPTGWLTGLGLSAFTSLTGSTEPYSHSMFVDCLVEMGLVAFGILIVMLIYSARKCLELIQFSTGHPEDRSAAVVLVALCAYQLLLMNKQGEVWASQNTVVYFLLLAKVVSPPMRDSYERELPEPVADATAHDAEGGALATP
jgi:ABC-type multidrug transport system fused ATPase/permease subunit